jgi:hypothetical protein
LGNCRNKQLHLYDKTIVIEQYIPVKFGNIKLSAPLSNSNNKLWKMWFCFNVQVNIKIDKLNLNVKSFSVSAHVSYCCIRSGELLKWWNMFVFLNRDANIYRKLNSKNAGCGVKKYINQAYDQQFVIGMNYDW